jgi:hypothetical protein
LLQEDAMDRSGINRRTINKHLLMSAWFLLLVLVLSVGMVWTKTMQAHGLLRSVQPEAQVGWDPIEMEGSPLTDVTEDILGVALSSVAVGLVIGLAGPWRVHMRNLRVERIYAITD